MKIGDKVRVARLPQQLPQREADDLRTRQIFELCVGRVFPVVGLVNGLIELEVGEVVGERAYMHSIWIEPDCVKLV